MMNVEIPDKLKAAKQLILEKDFKRFLKWNFKQNTMQTFDFGDHHQLMVDVLQQVLDGKIKNLKIEIPPRYSKTEMVKQFCAAGFARNPESQFIYTSYSDTLALKCSKEVRDSLLSDKFQEHWPIKIKTDTKSKKLWETDCGEGVGGGFYAVSFGGPITGFGAGKKDSYRSKTAYKFNGALIIDDPLKAQDRHRKVARQEAIDYYTGTLPSRYNSPSVPTILIMQRLHKDDLAGYIDQEEGDDWVTLRLSAIKDDGTPLWPEMHSIEDLERLARNSEMFNAQYLQEPIALGGNIIKPALFQQYQELPLLRRRFMVADTALKDKEQNDRTCFQCWGIGYDNRLYLIDLWKGKIKSIDLKDRFMDFWNKQDVMFEVKQYGHMSCAYIEDKASGTQLVQEIQREGRIPVQPVQRNRSKLELVVDHLLPKLASSYLYVPVEAPWKHDYFCEMEEFSEDDSHKYDDQIDTTLLAVEVSLDDILVDKSEVIEDNLRRRSAKQKKARKKRR